MITPQWSQQAHLVLYTELAERPHHGVVANRQSVVSDQRQLRPDYQKIPTNFFQCPEIDEADQNETTLPLELGLQVE